MTDSFTKINATERLLKYHKHILSASSKDTASIQRNLLNQSQQKLETAPWEILNRKEPASLMNAIKDLYHYGASFSQDGLSQLLILPESIPYEIKNQHQYTNLFKGEFFDLLRSILKNNPHNERVENAVVQILKEYISESSNTNIEKNMKLSLIELSKILQKTQNKKTMGEIRRFIKLLDEGHSFIRKPILGDSEKETVVIGKILSFIEDHIDKANNLFKSASEQILKVILAGQSMKSPMLHFVLPIKYEDISGFGELWVDSNSENEEEPKTVEKSIRMLLIIDITSMGRFEIDIFFEGKKLDTHVYCPPSLVNEFFDLEEIIRNAASKAGLHSNRVQVMVLKQARILREVFPNSHERRDGINVKA